MVVEVGDEHIVRAIDGEERGPGELVTSVALLPDLQHSSSRSRVGRIERRHKARTTVRHEHSAASVHRHAFGRLKPRSWQLMRKPIFYLQNINNSSFIELYVCSIWNFLKPENTSILLIYILIFNWFCNKNLI